MVGHDPGDHVIVEREDRDGWFADGKGRGGDDWRQKTFEPLPRFGKLSRHPWAPCMNLSADTMCHQPDDALTIGGRQRFPRIGQALRQTVDPDATVWVQHHLDDTRVLEKPCDRSAERGTQHACPARPCLGMLVACRHVVPIARGRLSLTPVRDRLREPDFCFTQQVFGGVRDTATWW